MKKTTTNTPELSNMSTLNLANNTSYHDSSESEAAVSLPASEQVLMNENINNQNKAAIESVPYLNLNLSSTNTSSHFYIRNQFSMFIESRPESPISIIDFMSQQNAMFKIK